MLPERDYRPIPFTPDQNPERSSPTLAATGFTVPSSCGSVSPIGPERWQGAGSGDPDAFEGVRARVTGTNVAPVSTNVARLPRNPGILPGRRSFIISTDPS
jgi:hypothetical protein